MSICPYVPMSLCPYVPMSLCLYVPMSPCPYVLMSLCPYVHMSFCPYVPMSLCPYVYMWRSISLYTCITYIMSLSMHFIIFNPCMTSPMVIHIVFTFTCMRAYIHIIYSTHTHVYNNTRMWVISSHTHRTVSTVQICNQLRLTVAWHAQTLFNKG